MFRRIPDVAVMVLAAAGAARAEAPGVATDIPPVHSLVAQVMDGAGAPALVVRPGASPHGYAMRPSEAAALQSADLVFWVGEALTPWLGDALKTLAEDAKTVELMEVEGAVQLEFREDAVFGEDGHDDHEEEEEEEDHGHDEHEEEHDDHDDHDAEDEHHGHAHEGADPHAWLDPENGKLWLNTIAATLSEVDPDNASVYFRNASAGRAEIDATMAEVETILAPVRGRNYVVFHDAFQYFGSRFDMSATGAISLGDASSPGPARVAKIRETVREMDISCIFSEPQLNDSLLETVIEGTGARTATIDPLGSRLEPGKTLYTRLLLDLARELADCLRPV